MKTRKKRQRNGFLRLFLGGKYSGLGKYPLLAGLFFVFAFFSYLSNTNPPHAPPLTHFSPSISMNAVDERLKVEIENEFDVPRGGRSLGSEFWRTKKSKLFYGCSNSSNKFLTAESSTHPNRYLLIATSGGLNQQRTGIVDAVVVAYMLNATLVIPALDHESYWKDSSNFSQIFDVDRFISQLQKDVRIIKELPTMEGKAITPYSTSVPRKCNAQCYQTRVLPLFEKKHAIQLMKFDYRLSNRLSTDLQKLRCRVNYHRLRFTDYINEMGRKLVARMRMKSKHFVALHLRFEPDMVAFSGCNYGLGENEQNILANIRKRWTTLHVNPGKQQRQGRCPLTPEEVGLMLRALGYGDDVHIYVASGEIFGGEATMAPLKALFPNFHTKETISSKQELAPFLSYSSRLAALDYIVCDDSDVFVTNNNGNMAKILAGRRRYFGHKPTIRPNAKKLYKVFMDRGNMAWKQFSSLVQSHQIGFMGEANEVRPGTGVFHEFPLACICDASQRNEVRDEHVPEDKPDALDSEYIEQGNRVETGVVLPMKLDMSSSTFEHPGKPKLEDIFPDLKI